MILDQTRDILAQSPATVGKNDEGGATGGDGAASDQQSAQRNLILAIPAHHRAEELVGEMLAKLMRPVGCDVEVIPSRMLPVDVETLVAKNQPLLLFVAVLPPGGLEQAKYLAKRLRTRFADQKIVVG